MEVLFLLLSAFKRNDLTWLSLVVLYIDGSVSHSVMSDSFATPWTIAHQAPVSMEFSRQECWSGILFSSSRPRGWTQISCITGRFFNHLSHQGSPYRWKQCPTGGDSPSLLWVRVSREYCAWFRALFIEKN